MADITLKIDSDRLTLDDLIVLESGKISALFMRDFLARFVINGNGDYAADDEARKLVGKLTLTELKETTDRLKASVKGLQETSVPPESASE